MSSRARASLPTSHRLAFALLALCLAAVLAVQTLQPRPAEAATTAEGVLEVVHEDHFAAGHSRHQYFLRGRGGEVTELLFDDRGPEGLGGRRVRVAGTPAGAGRMHVGTTEAVTETDVTTSEGTYNTSTAGTQKEVAVILFTFRDTPGVRPLNTNEARTDVFGLQSTGSTNSFYFDSSFGKWALRGDTPDDGGDVFDWVVVPYDSTSSCDFSRWGTAARSAAVEQGFVDSSYDHVVHIMPPSTCNFGGVAYMPGRYSWTVANPGDSSTEALEVMHRRTRQITSHELGHNFGVHHAGSLRCTDSAGQPVAFSTSCTVAEYGDPFNVMGTSRLERQLHGYHKGRLKWLGTTSAADTLTVSADGIHTLAPIESPAGLRALRIQRTFPKRGSPEYYYLELRGKAGFNPFLDGDPALNGVSIRLAPDFGTNAVSKLIDTTPGTDLSGYAQVNDFHDAPLTLNQTYTDAARGVSMTVTAVTPGESATVAVDFTSSTTGSTKPGKGNNK